MGRRAPAGWGSGPLGGGGPPLDHPPDAIATGARFAPNPHAASADGDQPTLEGHRQPNRLSHRHGSIAQEVDAPGADVLGQSFPAVTTFNTFPAQRRPDRVAVHPPAVRTRAHDHAESIHGTCESWEALAGIALLRRES